MKITALVENTSLNASLIAQHGLCLYVEMPRHKLLVDTAGGDAFLKNATALGIDLAAVDTLIITHGHSDHGGGLEHFLDLNHTAKVYVQRTAFLPHYSRYAAFLKVDIGLDPKLATHPRLTLLDGDCRIDDDIMLIANPSGKALMPKFNASLLERTEKRLVRDPFLHEQSVVLYGDQTVLIGGCAHRGIVNILDDARQKAGKEIDVCVSGFHLFKPRTTGVESNAVLAKLATQLKDSSCVYYTCHCTGAKSYAFLKERLGEQIQYLATGQTIQIPCQKQG